MFAGLPHFCKSWAKTPIKAPTEIIPQGDAKKFLKVVIGYPPFPKSGFDYRQLLTKKVRREKKDDRKTQDARGWKYIRGSSFLSLLLNWRPNLGLFGPYMAPHLREKGVECSVMSSPFCDTNTKPCKTYIKDFYMSNRKSQYTEVFTSMKSICGRPLNTGGSILSVAGLTDRIDKKRTCPVS
jgi:hypothetical protein